MNLALHISGWSKDRSRRVGAVIVGPDNEVRATGYNGFPRDVDDDVPARHQRPAKYAWTEHAERNAIYNAARVGVSTHGCTIYVPWYPCMECARAIVQSGISLMVAQRPDHSDPTWGDSFRMVDELFEEVGFVVRFVEIPKAGGFGHA
jgi:dCMP deaminase